MHCTWSLKVLYTILNCSCTWIFGVVYLILGAGLLHNIDTKLHRQRMMWSLDLSRQAYSTDLRKDYTKIFGKDHEPAVVGASDDRTSPGLWMDMARK